MTDPFYKSPIIGQEIKEMEQLYMDLARLSIDYPKMDDNGKLDHINSLSLIHISEPTRPY